MHSRFPRVVFSAAMLVLLAIALCQITGCGSQTTTAQVSVKGPVMPVQAKLNSSGTFQDAREGDKVEAGGAIRTGENGRSSLLYPDGTEIAIQADTYFEVKAEGFLGRQTQGSAIYKVKPQKAGTKVETPHGVTAVLGTTFLVKVASSGTAVWVEEGTVEFATAAGEKKAIKAGENLSYSGTGALGTPAPTNPVEQQGLFNPGAPEPALNQR
ncbi:MAG TPA: FecR family protein [Candidatus Ozemobacteraceae bacterium]|nr:FecR family protein [Candidatus Ozemobacteraceae bacterium]